MKKLIKIRFCIENKKEQVDKLENKLKTLSNDIRTISES